MQRFHTSFFLFVLLILSVVAILPFLNSGFFPVHDDTQVARVSEMKTALLDGVFPVRWVSNLGYGYGYPIFNFYAPFPYYLGGILAIIIGSALVATKLTFIAAIILSGVAMYALVSQFFSRIPALVAGVVYIYFPYHAVNVYVRGNLNEVVAYALLPVILLGFFKLYYVQASQQWHRMKWIISTAVFLTLLVVSHNLSAYMTAVVLGLLSLCGVIFSKAKKEFIVSVGCTVIAAILMSAFYWLPVLGEMKYTNVLSQVGGNADFRDHFVCITQLWNSPWGYSGSEPGCVDGMSFKLGKITILGFMGSLVALLWNFIRTKKGHFSYLIGAAGVGGIVSIFLTIEYSRFMWEIIPGMEYLQFPWRFLNFVGVFIAFTIGIGTYLLLKLKSLKKVTYIGISGFILIMMVEQGKLFTPQSYTGKGDDYYTRQEVIRYDASKLSDEYLPLGFTKPQSREKVPNNVIKSAPHTTVEVLEEKTGYVKLHADSSQPTNVIFNIAYFPAWQIRIDGIEQSYTPESKLLSVDLPRGSHTVELQFIQTPIERVGNIISLVSGILVAATGIYLRKRNYPQKKSLSKNTK